VYTENTGTRHLFHRFITNLIMQYSMHYVCHLL